MRTFSHGIKIGVNDLRLQARIRTTTLLQSTQLKAKGLECTDQEIFVDLLVAVIRRKECSAMKWSQSFAITLVDHRSIVKQMMQLCTKSSDSFTDSAILTISNCL